jgi:hypothetical protein
MSAKTRDGVTVWRRDIFADATLAFVPPPRFENEPPLSLKELREMERSYIASRRIDRMGIEPDCMFKIFDRERPSQYKGRYILAGDGTHEYYLIDAKTGDLVLEEIN